MHTIQYWFCHWVLDTGPLTLDAKGFVKAYGFKWSWNSFHYPKNVLTLWIEAKPGPILIRYKWLQRIIEGLLSKWCQVVWWLALLCIHENKRLFYLYYQCLNEHDLKNLKAEWNALSNIQSHLHLWAWEVWPTKIHTYWLLRACDSCLLEIFQPNTCVICRIKIFDSFWHVIRFYCRCLFDILPCIVNKASASRVEIVVVPAKCSILKNETAIMPSLKSNSVSTSGQARGWKTSHA